MSSSDREPGNSITTQQQHQTSEGIHPNVIMFEDILLKLFQYCSKHYCITMKTIYW